MAGTSPLLLALRYIMSLICLPGECRCARPCALSTICGRSNHTWTEGSCHIPYSRIHGSYPCTKFRTREYTAPIRGPKMELGPTRLPSLSSTERIKCAFELKRVPGMISSVASLAGPNLSVLLMAPASWCHQLHSFGPAGPNELDLEKLSWHRRCASIFAIL